MALLDNILESMTDQQLKEALAGCYSIDNPIFQSMFNTGIMKPELFQQHVNDAVTYEIARRNTQ